jgi:hypothetical protein
MTGYRKGFSDQSTIVLRVMGTRTYIQKLNVADFLNQLNHLGAEVVSDVGELRTRALYWANKTAESRALAARDKIQPYVTAVKGSAAAIIVRSSVFLETLRAPRR